MSEHITKIRELGDQIEDQLNIVSGQLAMSRELILRHTEPYVEIDEFSRVLEWNAGAEQVFGWKRAEILDKPIFDFLVPPRYREAHLRGMRHFLATGEAPVIGKEVHLEALTKDGSELKIRLSILSAKNGKGGTWIFAAFLTLDA